MATASFIKESNLIIEGRFGSITSWPNRLIFFLLIPYYPEAFCSLKTAQAVPQASAEIAEPEILYLDILINGLKQAGIYPFVRRGKEIWISADELSMLNLKDTSGFTEKVFFDKHFFLLPPWISAVIKMDDLLIEITVPAGQMKVTIIQEEAQPKTASPSTYGFYWNYDFSLYHQPLLKLAQFMTAHKPVFTSPFGSLSNQFMTKVEQKASIVRLETSYLQDYLPYQLRITVGDFATDAPSFISTVAAAGIKISKGYLFQTGSLSFPSMSLSGYTPRPADAEIWINDALSLKKEIPMGGFLLDNLNLPDGANSGELLIKDGSGIISSIPFSYYGDSELLRPGLTSYSYSAGFLRKNYGTKSFSYGGPALFGSQKIGISNFWTTSFHTQISLENVLFGLEQRFKLFNVGSTGLATLATRNTKHWGFLISPQIQLNMWRSIFRTRAILTSTGYAPITMAEETKKYPSLNISSALRLDLPYVKYSSINHLFGLNQNKINHTIGLRQSLPAIANFNASLSADYDIGNKSFLFFAFLSYQLFDRHRVSLEFDKRADQMQAITGLNGNSDPDKSHKFAYNISSGLSKNFHSQGNINYENAYLRSHLDIWGAKNLLAYSTGMAGSFSIMKSRLFFSRPVEQGLILIELPGQKDTQIYQNGTRIIGKTDSEGFLLVPNLIPYDKARLNIDFKEVNLFASSNDFNDGIELVPGFQTAHSIKFATKMVRYLHFSLYKDNKKLLPGTILNIDGHEQSFIMNEGDAYLEVSDNQSMVSGHDQAKDCFFQIPLPVKKDDVVIEELGNIECLPKISADTSR